MVKANARPNTKIANSSSGISAIPVNHLITTMNTTVTIKPVRTAFSK